VINCEAAISVYATLSHYILVNVLMISGIIGEGKGVTVSSLPLLPTSFSPFIPSHSPFIPFLRSRTPELQLEDLGESCEHPWHGLGQSPNWNWIWCILHSKGQSGTKILLLAVYAGLTSDSDHRRMDWIHIFSVQHAHLQLQFTGKILNNKSLRSTDPLSSFPPRWCSC